MFYQFMSRMVNSNNEDFISEKDFFKTIYSITAFPMKNLFSLRKKHRSGTLVQKSVPNRNRFRFLSIIFTNDHRNNISPIEIQGEIRKPKSSFSWWPSFGYAPVPRSTSFSTPLHSPDIDSVKDAQEKPKPKIWEQKRSKSTTSIKDEKPSVNPRDLEKQEIDKLFKNFKDAR